MKDRNSILQVRTTDAEKASFEVAAAAAGVSLSSWVRERLRETAMSELQRAGIKVPFLEALRRSA